MDAVKKLRAEKSQILFETMGTCQLSTFTVGSEITERRSICFGNFFVVVLHFLTKLTFYIVNRDDRAAKNQCKFLRSDGLSLTGDPP